MNGNPPDLPQSKTSGLATTSLVLGILALVLCFLGPLFAIPAVICGHVAHSRIKNSGGLLGGKGLATGGLITGYLSFAMIPVVGLLAAIAIPNFVKARDTAMNNACINQLQQIDAAKQQWALEKDKKEDAFPLLPILILTLRVASTICIVPRAAPIPLIQLLSSQPALFLVTHFRSTSF